MRLAIISDIHEDIVSLKLALQKIEKLACDEIICLGDISGFSVPHYRYFDTRNAHECLRLVKENCKLIIAGNHDLYASRRLPEKGTDFNFPGNWYSMDYYQRKDVSKGRVWLYDHDELDPLYSQSDIDQLKGFPEQAKRSFETYEVLFTHYIKPNMSGALKEFHHVEYNFGQHMSYLKDLECNLGFVGHAHYSGLYIATGERTIRKAFNRKYELKDPACVVVPSIAGNQIGNGFCLFDVTQGWVKAIRI